MMTYQYAHCNDEAAEYYDSEFNTFFCGGVCQLEFYTLSGKYHGGDADKKIDFTVKTITSSKDAYKVFLIISKPDNMLRLQEYLVYNLNTYPSVTQIHEPQHFRGEQKRSRRRASRGAATERHALAGDAAARLAPSGGAHGGF